MASQTESTKEKLVATPGDDLREFEMSEAEVAQNISTAARNLLEKYSGLRPEEVVPHVAAIQKRAYSACPHSYRPYVGLIRFLAFPLLQHPRYLEVLARVSPAPLLRPQVLVDLGCCCGQDLRQLSQAGGNISLSLGIETERSFIAMGKDLFRDGNRAPRFETADISDKHDPFWGSLQRQVDVVHVGNFLHTLDWNRQVAAVVAIMRLLKDASDTIRPLVLGSSMGCTAPGEVPIAGKGKTGFFHDPESFRKMWKEAGKRLGLEFAVFASFHFIEKELRIDDLPDGQMRKLLFHVRFSSAPGVGANDDSF